MSFFQIYFEALIPILTLMTILWLFSILKKNVSIVDAFWGIGFMLTATFYFFRGENQNLLNSIVLLLIFIWGLRLSIYITWRNWGKGEDFRYAKFRKDYGENRYWWISFFQTFLLQGILVWLISAPLLAIQYFGTNEGLSFTAIIALLLWIIGFTFEAGGDYQLSRFKSNPENKGKVLKTGFWKYTRHPNYFGDATVWWAFGLFALSAGCGITVLSSLLMSLLIIKVSGVSLLEKTLKTSKSEYQEYCSKTNAFFPWFPKK